MQLDNTPRTVLVPGAPWPEKGWFLKEVPKIIEPAPSTKKKRNRRKGPLTRVLTRNLKLYIAAYPGITSAQVAEGLGIDIKKTQKRISRLHVAEFLLKDGHKLYINPGKRPSHV